MSVRRPDLLDVLNLEQLEVNLFRGRSPQVGWQRVFGGQVIGQALVAAMPHRRGPPAAFAARLFPHPRRPEGADHLRRRPHPRRQELHDAPRGRDPARPADLHHDGIVSLRRTGPRASGADAGRAAAGRTAERSRDRAKVLPTMPEAVQRYYESERPIELRPVEYNRYLGKKYPERLPRVDPRDRQAARRSGDPPMRARLCVRHDAARHGLAPHGRTLFEKEFMGASLDHALWLHRPFRADDWLLYAQDTPNMFGSRGFSRGLIFRGTALWWRASRRRVWCDCGKMR